MSGTAMNRRNFLGAGAAALATLRGVPSVAPMSPHASITLLHEQYDSERPSIRVLESNSPNADGGALSLRLAECDYPEDYAPGSVWLQLYQANGRHDKAWGSHIQPHELDALLANLTALRDAARARGLLPAVLR